MPEGDTIHRSAARLQPVMVGATVISARDNGQFVDSRQLLGASFHSVEARGKHLLMHLSDQRVVHSHMGMRGSWRLYDPKQLRRETLRWAAMEMVLETAESGAVIACFAPKTLELLSPTQYRRHRWLHRLGPDLLTGGVEVSVVLPRFRVHAVSPIGEVVMNQSIISGIGNVYKSEILFLERIDPFSIVAELSDEQLTGIVSRAESLLLKNLNRPARQTRLRSDGNRFWVYRRKGQPCFSCRTTIAMRRQGDLGRSTYWCPACQRTR